MPALVGEQAIPKDGIERATLFSACARQGSAVESFGADRFNPFPFWSSANRAIPELNRLPLRGERISTFTPWQQAASPSWTAEVFARPHLARALRVWGGSLRFE